MTDEPTRVGALTPDHDDPDLAPPAPDESGTQLDGLMAGLEKALAAEVEIQPFVVEVQARPGVQIRYMPEIDDEKLSVWRGRAKDKKAPDGVNAMRFMCIVLANCCEAIGFQGQFPTDNGDELTFASARIKGLYSLRMDARAADVVRKVYGNDAHVLLHGNEVLEKAGFGDEVVEVEEGPTGLS